MAAGIGFDNTPHMRHVLVVHSDMRQSARPLDIEHLQVVPVNAALAAVAQQHLDDSRVGAIFQKMRGE